MLHGYLEAASRDCAGAVGIIHPLIRTWAAPTGRIGCQNPNLLSVEKPRGEGDPFHTSARDCFVPTRAGRKLLLLDYSGIEMRLIAHFSGDEVLCRLFREGEDPHTSAARLFFAGIDWDNLPPEEKKRLRALAKNGNFATAYGAGQQKLLQTLAPSGLGMKALIHGILRHHDFFRGFHTFYERAREKARLAGGYVRTLLGRRVACHELKDAANYLIQGSGADLLKAAVARISREIPDSSVAILFPHDEIIIECDEIEPVFAIAVEAMVSAGKSELNVPLEVEVKVSEESWGKASVFSA